MLLSESQSLVISFFYYTGKTSSIKSKKQCWLPENKSEINSLKSSKWVIKCKEIKSASEIKHDERNKVNIDEKRRDNKATKRLCLLKEQVKSNQCKDGQVKLQTNINVVKNKIVIYFLLFTEWNKSMICRCKRAGWDCRKRASYKRDTISY